MTPKNRNGGDSGLEPTPKKSVSDKSNNTEFSGDCQDIIALTLWKKTGGYPTKRIDKNTEGAIIKDSSQCSIS